MKKLLLLLPVALMLFGCRQEASEYLPDIPSDALQAKLTKANSGLTTDDSTEELTANLTAGSATYSVKIGAPCYAHSRFDEFVIKQGGYVKSASTYHVDRLIVDFYSTKGVNFEVFNNAEGTGEKLTEWKSKVETVDSTDGGLVYEYKIESTGWMIKNTSSYKPGFYSVTVVFTL